MLDRVGTLAVVDTARAGYQDVEIAHRLAAAAQRTGGCDLVDAGNGREIFGKLLGFDLRVIDEIAAADALVVFDGLDQLEFVLLAHAGKFTNLPGAREFLHSIHVGNLVGAPDQRDRFRPQTLDLQQLQHRRVIFLEQLGVQREPAVLEQFLQVFQHAFADSGNGQHFLGIRDQVGHALREILDGLGGVAIRTNAERVLAVDFEKVGGLVQQVGDGFVIHGKKQIKQDVAQEEGG